MPQDCNYPECLYQGDHFHIDSTVTSHHARMAGYSDAPSMPYHTHAAPASGCLRFPRPSFDQQHHQPNGSYQTKMRLAVVESTRSHEMNHPVTHDLILWTAVSPPWPLRI